MTLSFVNDAKESVKTFHNGRGLSAAFNTVIDAAYDGSTKLAARQEGLSLLVGNHKDLELTQFSVLYGAALHRMGLSQDAQISFVSWAELLPDRSIGETTDHIAIKVDKVFKANEGGLIVIRDAYKPEAKTGDEIFAFRVLEEALNEAKQKHPLLILAGKSSDIKANLGKNNQRLSFGQNIGL